MSKSPKSQLTASQQKQCLIQLREKADGCFETSIVIDSTPGLSEQDFKEFVEIQLNLIVSESIDAVLSSLSEPVRNTIYIQLQAAFDINKDEIPQKIPEFCIFMRQSLGVGFFRLERKIVSTIDGNLKAKIGYDGEAFLSEPNLSAITLKEYVYSLYKFSLG